MNSIAKQGQEILNSIQGRKMLATLNYGFESEKKQMAGLVEFNFINELPESQKVTYNALYSATKYDCSADFATALIKNKPIKWR